MIVLIKLQLNKSTKLVQYDVKIWFEKHEDRYMFCDERHVHLIMEKTCDEVPKRHNRLWTPECEIRLQTQIGQAV
jgi:hypothetical protein